MISTVAQLFGLVFVVFGVGLWSIPAAFIVAGFGLLAVGVALERGSDARKTD